jgi:plastocyanin
MIGDAASSLKVNRYILCAIEARRVVMKLDLDELVRGITSAFGVKRLMLTYLVVAMVLILLGCGGSPGQYTSGTTSPTTPSGSGSTVTISIAGVLGAQSFVPNPTTVRSGDTVQWKNNDSTRHHIVLDDGTYDSGVLEAGATSPPLAIAVAVTGQPYHCSIHPSMVGQMNLSGNASVAR